MTATTIFLEPKLEKAYQKFRKACKSMPPEEKKKLVPELFE